MTGKRDEWRQRAIAAEAALATLSMPEVNDFVIGLEREAQHRDGRRRAGELVRADRKGAMSAIRKRLEVPMRAWSAREILHALLEHGDIDVVRADGSVRIAFDVPAELADELMLWDDANREDDQVDYAAEARSKHHGSSEAA